jgi:hypothetical protein
MRTLASLPSARWVPVAGVSLGVAIAAYYALWLNTELWNHVLPPEGPRWRIPPRWGQLTTLYTLYLLLGVVGRLFSRRVTAVVVPGLLGFVYGLPSDGGRWAWSDLVGCCGTPVAQMAFLWRTFQEMSWSTIAVLHGAVILALSCGWFVADIAFTVFSGSKPVTAGT